MDARPNTPQGDELELLSVLVHDYEEKAFLIDKPDLLTAIRFRMEQKGLQSDYITPSGGRAAWLEQRAERFLPAG